MFCLTQFLGQIEISRTKFESNIPTFEDRQTKVVLFELSNNVQSNIPHVPE
jgi:hypothetical protein